MKTIKYIALFIAMQVTLLCYSQTRVQSRDVKRIAGKAYLLSKGDQYEIREKVVLAKLKAEKKQVRDGIKVIKSHSFGMLEIAVPDDVSVEEYIVSLENTGDFEIVEFDTYIKSCMSPNDTYYNNQWGPGHIHADAAWEITTGSPSVKIAVIEDSGFELYHPDLNNGSDTYSNISVSEGVDYVFPFDFTPTGNHGTLVAGIIGAKTNNGIGIAGIAGGNNCEGSKIIPYHAISGSQTISAIRDAVDKGAKVINMSYSATENFFYNLALAYAHENGVTLVCSSGKTGDSIIAYPASSEYTIAVGAIDSSNDLAVGSNYGNGLDLVAPGDGIKSTSLNNGYDYDDGTSFAAPHVSGVVALMLSVNPSLTPDEIRTILHNTTLKIKYGPNVYNTSGWSQYYGYGLVNACEAVFKAMNNTISGSSLICSSSSGTYTISNLPSCCTVTWDINNSDFNITTSGNQCTVTYTGSQEYGIANLIASISYNNCSKQITKKIVAGTPPLDAELLITGGDGSHVYWTSNLAGNTVDIEELFNIPIYYTQYEANLYRISPITFEPETTPIRHWSFGGTHYIVDYLNPGWYMLEVRGINSCGTSDWIGTEVECVDTDMLRSNGNETELTIMYSRQGQMLTVSVNQATRSTTDNAYTIQLWNELNMVRELRPNDPVIQIPMTGLKNGLYTVRYVNRDEVIAKKFMKF